MNQITQKPQFTLIHMPDPKLDGPVTTQQIDEAKALIDTYGGQVTHILTQNQSHLNQGTFIGKGKVQEIANLIQTEPIKVVVINHHLEVSQKYRLLTLLQSTNPNIEVWDRTNLILHIFKKHAHTAEAKLQIKLAEVKHRGPELQGMGKQMSQQGAGIGTRGMGETNTEIMKRHWRGEIRQIQADLTKLTSNRERQMEHRKRLQQPTISIIGYTNAGKSTLFNLLTRKQNLVEDAPFATLDSSVSKLYLQSIQKLAFVTDTIGFIQNLPTELIGAFQSTLLETIHADLLLHLIDLTDPFLYEKIATVESILTDLSIVNKPQIYVFNKIDNLNIENKDELIKRLTAKYAHFHPQFISAKNGHGIDTLIQSIENHLIS